MHVDAASAAATLSRDGRTYRFCSRACAARFDPRVKDATEFIDYAVIIRNP
jgi:YHS domain-containing protein